MTKTYTLTSTLLSLAISFLVTAIGLPVLAFLLYKFGFGTMGVELGVCGIYLLASALGGFFMGKRMENRRFLWGMLVGVLYVILLVGVSVLAGGGAAGVANHGLSTLLICLGGGTLGGMVS